ncbi:MAG: TonB-dependent receptor [Chitinophagales bacterium]|nr:TonB-dependent receptor [Chitinophagales bacterium]
MKKLFTLLFLNYTLLSAQTVLTGKVADDKGATIPAAMLKVEGAGLGAKTDANGQYKITFPNGGTYTIVVSYIGYKKETISINIQTGESMTKDITLKSGGKKIKEVKVKGAKSKSSETATLAEQKASIAAVEIIGSQEMSRKGASDAQAAIVKMAGISKEEGTSQIFVRGLGDRYNATMLNGMFLPSDNPEFKNISLEYFPIDIIQSIGVSKTYNNTLLGDFGGATINIATKEYYGKPFIAGSVKAGLNSNAIAHVNKGHGVGFFGNVENSEIPTTVNGQFVSRQWDDVTRTAPRINAELNINGGWSHSFNEKLKLSLFGTASFSNKYQHFKGMSQLLDAQGNIRDSAGKESFVYTVNQNAMVNAVLSSPRMKTKLNYLVFRTAANQFNVYDGLDGNNGNITLRKRNIKDISNLHVAQLINEFKVNDRLQFIANASFNAISNDQPDRLTQAYQVVAGQWAINTNQDGNMSSYYQSLSDRDYTAGLAGRYSLKKDSASNEDITAISLGYTLRYKTREFTQYDYIFKANVQNPTGFVFPDDISRFFSASNIGTGDNNYRLFAERQSAGRVLAQIYDGDLSIHSPSVAIEHKFTPKITVAAGARVDLVGQNVNWDIQGNRPPKDNVFFEDFKILPFVNAKYEMNDKQNLKFAFSKTYTLPQFKELAPFLYYDISTFNTRGNPYLYSSDNYNFDLKWEFFPTKSELISLAGFGKMIQNPINKVFEAATGQLQMTYVNSGDMAMVTGIELEVKKTLIDRMNSKDTIGHKYALSGGFNICALYSRQDLNNDKATRETKGYTTTVYSLTETTLQGASPVVFNVDLTYKTRIKSVESQATVVLNYFHDRLYAIGAQTAGNAYERGVATLDLITRHTLNKNLSISANLRNLLNPDIVRYQEFPGRDLVISTFKKGIDASLGINFNF